MGIKGKNDRMVVLACEDCKERNYTTVKNKKNSKERMELNKYCPTCKKHTVLVLALVTKVSRAVDPLKVSEQDYGENIPAERP